MSNQADEKLDELIISLQKDFDRGIGAYYLLESIRILENLKSEKRDWCKDRKTWKQDLDKMIMRKMSDCLLESVIKK